MNNPIYTLLSQSAAKADPQTACALSSELEHHCYSLLNGVRVVGELLIQLGAATDEPALSGQDLIELGALLQSAVKLNSDFSSVNTEIDYQLANPTIKGGVL
ncbi:hypothetical protein FHQ26_09545 [Testudinibacter sp. TR-2022]|uniref:hypothetical protein n=1 Tax=Testudinibacter sp. TR-2022 TaxID=2585029 RepID=UPI00111BA563|nr:hypothetical protein [Testudinibacter sp. TR-2022]TNH03483.1 hypothetical protein FHQ22_07945 [Pasteurellaceae bacterium Phil31]TNH07944.1 hypothetical protein FHQ26_09545 [Testudinibacter sp. TR-2022]TNH10319.1 hypothetical protein FHQ25_05465 [Testudinibacter sp. TR-2022]